jgi:Fe-Mn family superoxide dismutase
MTRRQWIKTAFGTAAAFPLLSYAQTAVPRGSNQPPTHRPSRPNTASQPTTQDLQPLIIPFDPLPYDPDALEPFISKEIMDLHYGRHHAGYHRQLQDAVTKLNLTTRHSIESILRNLDSYPEDLRTTLRNHGGGHYNHNLFWHCMKRNGGGRPIDELGNAINEAFGNYEAFQKEFTANSLSLFGSGWCWLSLSQDKTLLIETTPNQDNPLMQGKTPIFGIDLWEHAYYLQYQNRRADYIEVFFKIINWDYICDRYRNLIASTITTQSPLTSPRPR